MRFDDGEDVDDLCLNELRHPRDEATAAVAAAPAGAPATPAAVPAAVIAAAPAAAPPPARRNDGDDGGALRPTAARPAAAPPDAVKAESDDDDGALRDPKRARSPAEAEDQESRQPHESGAKRARRPAVGSSTAPPPREAAAPTRPRPPAHDLLTVAPRPRSPSALAPATDAAGGDLAEEDQEGGRGGAAAAGSGSRDTMTHALTLSGAEWALLAEAASKDPRLKRAWEAIQPALASQRPTPTPRSGR